MLSHASAASAAATPPPKGAALKLVVDPAAPAVGLDGLAQLSPAVTPVAPAKPNELRNTNITSSDTTMPKEPFVLNVAASSDTAAATTMDCEMDDEYDEGFALGFESAGVISSDADATACSRGYSDGYSDGFANLEANPPSVFASEMTSTGAAAATVVSVAEQEMMEEEEAEDDDDDDVEFAIGYDDGWSAAIEEAYNTGHDDGLQDSELSDEWE